uniref:Dynamin-type G domain-containing protein n=1 Tax=Panagrolaimus sp. JU765 TaxID=591449 RepID=A0AC34RFY5_9BILA
MGMTLAADGTMPFQSLNIFGGAFLTHLRGATLDVPLLKHVYFIDTPGILSGQNQTISREYNFANVTRFIADKVDLIVLLFDTSKLDISDEYKLVLQNLKGNEEKIKIVLNKADSVDPGELVRVRGALMWSLSKIIDTPEVPKVYIGSFDGRAAKNSEILDLFKEDYVELFKELQRLPAAKNSEILDLFKEDYVELFKELQRLPSQLLARRVNDIIKRAKNVRIHALLMDEIMRGMWYKSDSQLKKQLKDEKLKGVFTEVKQRFRLADSDMPKYEAFKESAKSCPLRLWNKVDTPMLVKLEEFLMKDVAKILEHMPEDEGDTDSFKKAFRDLLLQQNIEIPEEKKKEDDKDKEKADGEKKEE